MAAFDTTTVYGAGQSFGGRIINALTNVLGLLKTWNDERITRNTLSRLTDRELDDIGLIRGDIEGMR